MKIIETELRDVLILEPRVFEDDRGFFLESYNERTFAELDLPTRFVQDNHSGSRKGVLRGIHYQLQRPQGKLVRVLRGKIYDVAVDLRQDSPDFGHWAGLDLSAENRRMLWIPPGFGHGFLTLSDFAEVAYKTTDFYAPAPAKEHTVLWNDLDLAIAWPVDGEIILSEKDKAGVRFRDAAVYERSPEGSVRRR